MNAKNLLTVASAFSLIKSKDYDLLVNRHITTNFKWGEVFVGIRPNEWQEVTKAMLENAFSLALYLEKLRTYFGKPIVITSWLRVPSHNARVGGKPKTKDSKGSTHLYGLAVDFNVKGVPFDKNQMARLNEFHVGGLARADYNKDGWADFVHVDLGDERTWTY
jgi:uncharacterized protein YcbK (DUF882 family)